MDRAWAHSGIAAAGRQRPASVSSNTGENPRIEGYVFIIREPRVREKLEMESTFTDVVAYGEIRARQAALLSFSDEPGNIEAVAAMTRGNAVASFKRVVRFAPVVELDAPLPVEHIYELAGNRLTRSLGNALAWGGELGPQDLELLAEVTSESRPDLGAALEEVRPAVERSGARRVPEVLGFERDAVGVILDVAGLGRMRGDVLRSWAPVRDAPFLRGLESRAYDEDRMLANDLTVFGDWEMLEAYEPDVRRFADGRRQVTIANVNRTAVETSTGADLIYYSHDWDAYVLVQYKRMQHTADGWELRPTRAGRIEQELERLRALPRDRADAATADAFRLSDEAAYLKLCRELHVARGEPRLADGIYMPVSLYDLLASDDRLRGPRRGVRFRLDELRERWVTNGTFVEMVGRGFIGSRTVSTDAITDVIRAALEEGRSITLGSARDR